MYGKRLLGMGKSKVSKTSTLDNLISRLAEHSDKMLQSSISYGKAFAEAMKVEIERILPEEKEKIVGSDSSRELTEKEIDKAKKAATKRSAASLKESAEFNNDNVTQVTPEEIELLKSGLKVDERSGLSPIERMLKTAPDFYERVKSFSESEGASEGKVDSSTRVKLNEDTCKRIRIDSAIVSEELRSGVSYSLNESLEKKIDKVFPDRKDFEKYITDLRVSYPKDNAFKIASNNIKNIPDSMGSEDAMSWGKLLLSDNKHYVHKMINASDAMKEAGEGTLPERASELLSLYVNVKHAAPLAEAMGVSDEENKKQLVSFVNNYVEASLRSNGDDESSIEELNAALSEGIKLIQEKRPDKILPDLVMSRDDLVESFSEGFKVLASELSDRYYFRRIDSEDTRSLYLGKLTACCQSLDGHSRDCVRYGFRNEGAGFYGLFERGGKEVNPLGDRIVAQSYGWIADGVSGEEGRKLVFDSIEGGNDRVKDVLALFQVGVASRLSKDKEFGAIKGEDGLFISSINVGTGGGTPPDFIIGDLSREEGIKRDGAPDYRDSRLQYNFTKDLEKMQKSVLYSTLSEIVKNKDIDYLKKFLRSENKPDPDIAGKILQDVIQNP
jgi:hypothetical protein